MEAKANSTNRESSTIRSAAINKAINKHRENKMDDITIGKQSFK